MRSAFARCFASADRSVRLLRLTTNLVDDTRREVLITTPASHPTFRRFLDPPVVKRPTCLASNVGDGHKVFSSDSLTLPRERPAPPALYRGFGHW